MSTNKYPFPTKAEILNSQSSDDVVLEHLGILYQRQTSEEQETKDTIFDNKRGFMSSHAVVGTTLAQKVANGEELTEEEWSKARGIVCRYGRQLAAHYRAEMLRNDPSLHAVARKFSAG